MSEVDGRGGDAEIRALPKEAVKESVIDFDQYDEQTEWAEEAARDWAQPLSSLVEPPALPKDAGAAAAAATTTTAPAHTVALEDISSCIPRSVLRSFEPGAPAQARLSDGAEADNSVLQALVSAVVRALSGDSVVTAPVLYNGLPWLGKISVSPGGLKGALVVKHRTYNVQSQVLAGGHVLPWSIGREWRYSDLRRLLVDDLQLVVSRHGLESFFGPLYAKFPPKTWQNRNSDETAVFRGKAIEEYIRQIVLTTGKIIEERQFAKNAKRGRRRAALAAAAAAEGSARQGEGEHDQSLAPSGELSERKNSLDALTGEGLGDVMSLIVTRLLGIDSELRADIAQVSRDLGALITSTPTDHCQVTKEFKITPQQAL